MRKLGLVVILVLTTAAAAFADGSWTFSPIDPNKRQIDLKLSRYNPYVTPILPHGNANIYRGYSNILLGGVQRKGYSAGAFVGADGALYSSGNRDKGVSRGYVGKLYIEDLHSDAILAMSNISSFEDFAMERFYGEIASETEKAAKERNGAESVFAYPSIDAKALRKNYEKAYVDSMSAELSRNFTLKILANVLDEEARYRNIPLSATDDQIREVIGQVLGSKDLRESARRQAFAELQKRYPAGTPFFIPLASDGEISAFLAGQGYAHGTTEYTQPFPATLEDLRSAVFLALEPLARKAARKAVIERALAFYPRYDRSAAGYASAQELDAIWEAEKGRIATWFTTDFYLTEIKIGNLTQKRAEDGDVDPTLLRCGREFAKAFEGPWAKAQETEGTRLWNELTQNKITIEQFNEGNFKLRRELPKKFFSSAASSMHSVSECRDVPITMEYLKQHVDTRLSADEFGPARRSEDEENRIRFGIFVTTDEMQSRAVTPSTFSADSHGNVHMYMFEREDTSKHEEFVVERQERKNVRYTEQEKELIRKVAVRVRRAHSERLHVLAQAYALSRLISDRYIIMANTSPMTIGGVYGVRLLSGVKNPAVWVSELFDVSSPKLRTRFLDAALLVR